MSVGCSSDPPPQTADLSPSGASTLISQKWSHDELNHFTVTFHSDTLIGCGVQNDLWKHVETSHPGFTISQYELTEAGRKALFAIDLNGLYPWGWFALSAPVFMYWLLVHVSGIPPLEQQMLRSRGEAFQNYQARVSAFIPFPPVRPS